MTLPLVLSPAVEAAKAEGSVIGTLLVERGYITEDQVVDALAVQAGADNLPDLNQ